MNALAAQSEITLDELIDRIADRVVEKMPTAQQKLDYSVDAEDLDATVTTEEALKYTGKGGTNLWEGVKRGLYPAPVTPPGKARRWSRRAWLEWQRKNQAKWGGARNNGRGV